ncbi:MAG: ABC transporter permease [Actinobacteria bacterium]|nr:ABC transporter permease [Actinomycetota bacterium]
MDKFLTFTVIGLSTSAIYAVISSGLVLTYTTTGVFNFAHGAQGMIAAFAYWQLRFAWGWPAPLALATVLLVLAPLFGALLERVIMRGLADASEAVRLVVSISLLVGLIGLAQVIWPPGESRPMSTFFAGRQIRVWSTAVTAHQLITFACALAVAVGLRLLLHRTRIGVSMRAIVDDRPLLLLNGARTDRVALLSWAIGASLAALGGILIAPAIALDAPSLSLLIVNAYAAAIFGRLRSIPLTFVGAIVIGLTEAYLFGYLPTGNTALAGLRLAAPAILLFVVLLVLPNRRLRTGVRSRERFPCPTRAGALLFSGSVFVAGIVMATTMSRPDLVTYGKVFSFGIIALSLVPLVGYAGQISLCQLSFAGIGAVVMAHVGGASGSPLGLVLAAVVAAAVGALVALPALRLSGIYLALATAAFAVALDRWVFNLPAVRIGPLRLRLFDLGSVDVAPLRLFGYRFDSPRAQMLLAAGAFALLALGVSAVRRGRLGRRLLAMRDSEAACATFGMDLVRTRLAVFTLSAAIAGVGGAIYATQLSSITPGNFDLVSGLPIFMLVVVGGAGMVGGALFAGIGLQGLLPALARLSSLLARWQTIAPALAGLGLGRNPSGAASDVTVALAPLRRDAPVLGAMLAAMGLLWAGRLAGAFGGWPFLAGLVVALAVAAAVAQHRAGAVGAVGAVDAVDAAGPAPAAAAATATVPAPAPVPAAPPATAAPPVPALEWMGITQPWTADAVAALDRVLGLPEEGVRGGAAHG